MPPLEQMNDEQFLDHAVGLLRNELGLDGFARFLTLYRAGTGDYTRDRHIWLDGLTIEQVVEQVNAESHTKAA